MFFYLLLPKIPEDMEQGYGREIWNGDMRRGYACRNKNARRRRAEIWENDMAGD